MTRSRRRSGPIASLGPAARPIVALMVLAGSLLLAIAFVGVSAPANATARERDALVAQIARLEAGLAEKRDELARKQSDAYVVDKARELGWLRPGEGMVSVDGVDAKPTTRPAVRAEGRLAKWWSIFFR